MENFIFVQCQMCGNVQWTGNSYQIKFGFCTEYLTQVAEQIKT